MKHERRSQWLRGVLDLCILASLRDCERYGYDLAQNLEGGGLGRVKGGTLYPLLARLEAAGLVKSRWQPGSQGPGRKYYALTQKGYAVLGEQSAEWCAFVTRTIDLIGERDGK
jgi:PadR family transcriptional regulator PadR